MDQRPLRETLEQLHSQLENTESVDEESRQLLEHLMADVEDLIDRDGEELKPEDHTVIDHLRLSIRKFEVSHPSLTISMGHLLDILCQSGI